MGRKLSYEEIKEYIEGLEGNECKLEMTECEFENEKIKQQKSNTQVKINIRCKCLNIFVTAYYTFKCSNKKQCNECGKESSTKKRAITNEQFLNRVKRVKGSEYEVLEEYVRNDKKLLIRHLNKKCNNYEFKMCPNDFINNNYGCPKCSGRMKKTLDQFKQEVYNLEQDEYTVLGEYKNNKTRLLMQHNSEGCNYYEYLVTPSDFLTGYRCPKCYGNIKKTHEEFVQEVYSLVEDEYTVIGKYIDYKTKVKIIHNNKSCEFYEFDMKPNGFFSGHRCPKCAGHYERTHQEFIDNVYEQECDNYSVLGEYKNQTTKILMRHNCENCNNYEWEVQPITFLTAGTRCPKCAGHVTKTTEEFKQDVFRLVKKEYEVIGEYINMSTKVFIKHNSKACNNHEYFVNPSNFLYQGSRCPFCAETKGEKKIRYYFQYNDIYFKTQYKFKDLKGIGGGLLKFDSVVFWDKEKTKLRMLIEYDGIFHYEKQFEGDGYEVLQIHDKLKNEYCERNNIQLLRIPYWEFDNIEEILSKAIEIPKLSK